LLIVKHGPAGSYRHVLLALDLSSAARDILRTAQSIVSQPGVDTSVVHAFEPRYGTLPYIPKGVESVGAANSPERAEAERAVRLLLRDHGNGLMDSNLILSAAFPAEAIVSSVSRLQPDLLVMGARGYGRFRRALLGSTATQVLDAVPCDVLLVPRGAKLQSRRRLYSHRPEKGTQTLA
jgi:nucleotide-binding universal stress UspA family protein